MVICASPHAHYPLRLEKTYFAHSFIDLNDFCCIRCPIWRFKKINWSAKLIKCCPKILNSRIQIGHMCQPHHARDPFNWEGISYSFLHWFGRFDAPFEALQEKLECKTIEWYSKILSSRIQTNHMCQPHHAHDPFHLEKAYLAYSFIDLSVFFFISCAI